MAASFRDMATRNCGGLGGWDHELAHMIMTGGLVGRKAFIEAACPLPDGLVGGRQFAKG